MATYEITGPKGITFEVNAPDDATEDEVMQYAQAQLKKIGAREKEKGSIIDPIMQGLTFGWADELGGLGARIGSGLAGAGPEQRDRMAAAETARQRRRLASFRELNPYSAAGAEMAGAVASGIPFARLAQSGLQLARVGAGMGGLAGMGAAEQSKELGAGMGAAFGGLFAGAVPAAGYAVRAGGQQIANFTRPIIDRVRQSPSTRAGRILGEQLQGAGVTPAQLRSRVRQLGPDATVAEAAGEAGISLGQGVIGADPTGQARLMAARNLGARVPGMSERLRGSVAETTGVTQRLQDSLDAVRDRQRLLSGRAYEKANAADIPLTNTLKGLLERKPMRQAFQEAKDAAETVGDELPPLFKLNELGDWEKAGVMPDMRAWDRMKQGIDRLIDSEVDSITGRMSPKGRDLTILKNQLLEELDQINPAYAEARRIFAGDEAIQSAMRTGERFLSMKTRDVHSAIKGMTPSEKESFLVGAVESMREKIGRSRSGEMGSFKFLETDNAMEKLRAIFPSGREGDKALAQLNRSIRAERTLRETENALLRGSQTQLRQAATGALGGQAGMPTGAEIISSPIRAGAQRMIGETMQALGRERQPTIDALSNLLFSSGNVNKAIAELQRRGVPQPVINQYLNRFSVGSASLAPAAGLLGGNLQ